MSTPFSAATAAYGNTAQLLQEAGKTAASSSSGGGDFSKMLAESVQSVVDNGNQADKTSLDMLSGKAGVVDMVTAVTQTELAIESMVTVRDRVISAYQEIMRMPI
ncbi:Flagellar hook-basal body complex protein FliE [hydrothermal vent metagenome]|uniref:Flagellar hook-basal body complex protein FliE n=1 Tax=hydrothermal vent metagenome TaxID=652676 RepID=A0A3B0TXX5_9ZZZZ